MKTLRVYDNGGKTIDRYTVLIPNININTGVIYLEMLGLSDNPNHPLGFNQFCGEWKRGSTKNLGKRIQYFDLPGEVREAIKSRLLQDLWILRL